MGGLFALPAFPRSSPAVDDAALIISPGFVDIRANDAENGEGSRRQLVRVNIFSIEVSEGGLQATPGVSIRYGFDARPLVVKHLPPCSAFFLWHLSTSPIW